MTAKLRLAAPDDLDRLEPMVASFHAIEGIDSDAAHRRAALAPLLDGSPHACVYMIGPARAPVGYIALCFGWSIEHGGLDVFGDEFFIREAVRGRGMGTEVLASLLPELERNGVAAVHLEVDADNDRAAALYGAFGFKRRDKYRLMTRKAGPID